MKQLLKVLALVLILILAIGALVACNDDPPPAPGPDDGSSDGDGDDKGDSDAKFTVTFKYIDAQGNDLADVDNYKESYHKNIKYGKDARDNKSGDVQLFADHVIVGWNESKEAAMAGTVDENALKNIKAHKTVYSVVRAKEMKTVTFLDSTGSNPQTKQYKEGEALGKDAPRPTELGKYFRKWEFVSNDEAGKTDSNETCIFGNCTFKAVMGATDGTIGKTSATIVVDGKKDPAYGTSNTYLAHNNKKMADAAKPISLGGPRAEPDSVKADTWMVWDGDYIYLLISVFDTKLTSRSEAYIRNGVDAWCNDAIELWYTFEQDATITTNKTRVGISASGDIGGIKGSAKYALPRSEYKGSMTGIFGGRSTHYEEIDYAVRNYINEKEAGADVSDLDENGVTNPSYIIELKLPAKTEGQADLTRAYEDWDSDEPSKKLNGQDLEDFKATGRLFGVEPKVDTITSYAFTPGDKLQVGDYVRFCLQVNDLRISVADLVTKYLDSPTLTEAQAADITMTQDRIDACQIKLFELDQSGVLQQASTYNLFTAPASTQNVVSMYLMFSLGGAEQGSYIVTDFAVDTTDPMKNQVMLQKVWDEAANDYKQVPYVRPDIVVD